jgi:hypothetical protein
MVNYPIHVQERFARLLQQRAEQSHKAKVAEATKSGKSTQVEDENTEVRPEQGR